MKKDNWEFIDCWAKKYKAVQFLGGKCIKCGNNDFRILIFHHKENETKEYNIAQLRNKSFSRIEQEIQKCVLLCPNCHHEYHYNKDDIKDIRHKKTKAFILEIKGTTKCYICGYDKYIGSLDFHHKEEKNKIFSIGSIFLCSDIEKLGQTLFDEIEKCDVLCKNCHALYHIDTNKIEDHIDEIKHKIWRKNDKAPIDIIIKYHKLGYENSKISKEINVPMSTISSILKRKGLSEH